MTKKSFGLNVSHYVYLKTAVRKQEDKRKITSVTIMGHTYAFAKHLLKVLYTSKTICADSVIHFLLIRVQRHICVFISNNLSYKGRNKVSFFHQCSDQ